MNPDPKPKRPKKRQRTGADPKYLEWLRGQACCACWFPPPSEAAHQRILGGGGIGIKPPDRDALPLCRYCHVKEHTGAVTFWGQGDKANTKDHVQMLVDWHIKKYEEER